MQQLRKKFLFYMHAVDSIATHYMIHSTEESDLIFKDSSLEKAVKKIKLQSKNHINDIVVYQSMASFKDMEYSTLIDKDKESSIESIKLNEAISHCHHILKFYEDELSGKSILDEKFLSYDDLIKKYQKIDIFKFTQCILKEMFENETKRQYALLQSFTREEIEYYNFFRKWIRKNL